MAYLQSRQDFEYLESVRELQDFVEIDAQMTDLMRNPTRKKAQLIYEDAISLWFDEARIDGFSSREKRLHAIAKRHGHKLYKNEVTK
jgi:hypothetical protein